MDEIESFAGVEIRFEVDSFPAGRGTLEPRAAATMVTHERATIYLPEFDEVDAHAVAHELLHIWRYWIEGVPQLSPLRQAGADTVACATFENCLEHLVVVPRETDYGFDRSVWDGAARFTWEHWPWPEIDDRLDRRNKALLGVLEAKLSFDANVHALATARLSADGLIGEAESLSSKIEVVLHSKERSAACLAWFMQVPRGILRLVYFDIRARKWQIAPVPVY